MNTKTRTIYRLENKYGDGIFQDTFLNWVPDHKFPCMDSDILESLSDAHLFACQTVDHLIKYFTAQGIKDMAAFGARIKEIEVPEDAVLEDENQCVFHSGCVIYERTVPVEEIIRDI